jgi:hypothetical protein
MPSNFCRLEWSDPVKALAIAVGAGFVAPILELLQKGELPDGHGLAMAVSAGLSAGLLFLAHNFLTNSKGEIGKAEPGPWREKPKAKDPFLPALIVCLVVFGTAQAQYEQFIPADPQLAVVRIMSHGASGTFIATQPGRSWILSCGHMFTDRQMRPSAAARNKPLWIDACVMYGPAGPAKARVLAVDYDADLSLIQLDKGPCHYLPVDQSPNRMRKLVSCGYDEMKWPCLMKPATCLSSADGTIYTREKPWHGRSGGGLIDAESHTLIGVVQGYETTGQRRGIYVSRQAVKAFLEKNGMHFGTALPAAQIDFPPQFTRPVPAQRPLRGC